LNCRSFLPYFALIGMGFMFAENGKPCKFYPYLDLDTVERKFYKFWKSM